MPAIGSLADPDCELCGGTGTDPIFFGDCTECWPPTSAHAREELWHARHQAAMIPTPDPWIRKAEKWEARQPRTKVADTWAKHCRQRAADITRRQSH
jgi:hypothetical protein